jgi:hypothetical protein
MACRVIIEATWTNARRTLASFFPAADNRTVS